MLDTEVPSSVLCINPEAKLIVVRDTSVPRRLRCDVTNTNYIDDSSIRIVKVEEIRTSEITDKLWMN